MDPNSTFDKTRAASYMRNRGGSGNGGGGGGGNGNDTWSTIVKILVVLGVLYGLAQMGILK